MQGAPSERSTQHWLEHNVIDTEQSLSTIEKKLLALEKHHYKNKLTQNYWLGGSSILTIPPILKSFRTRHHVALSFGWFQCFFFVVLVEVSLTFCQIFSLIVWHLLKWRCIVYIYFCVWFRFFTKKKKCHRLCSNEFALNFVLKIDSSVRRLINKLYINIIMKIYKVWY